MSFSFLNGFFGSPPKESQSMNNLARSPSSPFCTSPSQLQEVTLDPDGTFSNTMGMRSPSGPMRGRTVKEFEEQLTSLKKENFNLKLRIYFLEEKMGTNFTLDKDNIVKKNIELQVEMANLQKEVKEKHELLYQAVKAMELEEEEHRKYSQSKEEHMATLQQEIEELRTQLQAVLSKQNNPAASFIFDKTETLKLQIDALQRDCQSKDETINSLNHELSSANDRLIDFAQQIKEYEEKLAQAHIKNETLIAKMQEEQKTMEKLYNQLSSTNQKFSVAKFEFEQERKELEREKKSLERQKMMLDMRIGVLENDNKKNRDMIKDLQGKLESAVDEAKKNQNLAVSKSRHDQPSNSNTDSNFISVPDAAAPHGTPKKDPLHVQVNGSGRSSKVQLPATPDSKSLLAFERLLTECGDSDRIKDEFSLVKNEFNAQKQKIIKLKSEQLKACEIIKNMIDFRNKANDEIAQLKKAKEDLEKELESVVSKPQKDKDVMPLSTKVSELNITAVGTPPCEKSNMADKQSDDMEIVEQYKRLTLELEAKIEVLVDTLKEKDSQLQYIKSQYDEILNSLEEKENRIVDLEFELLSTNQNTSRVDRSLLEKGDMGSEKHSSFYKQELEEKNQEIEKLNTELKKCTCYLQEIVNKELWEKNREIEKLHKKQGGSPEVAKLKRELSSKDIQLKVLKEKISELGLDIKIPSEVKQDLMDDLSSPNKNAQDIKMLQEQLKMAVEEKHFFEERIKELQSSEEIIQKIKAENEEIRTDLERSERLRVETNEVCSILSTRLEELAIFLDSLLKQKSILGFLGSAKNKRLREIINNSLDLSRSLSMSLMANPEQSLIQLSNITALLNGSVFQDLSLVQDTGVDGVEEETHFSIIPDHISLTYESHLYKKSNGEKPDNDEVIAALREQVFKLKSELKLRDNELNRLNGNKESGVDRLTDSEEEKEVSKLFTPKSTSATIKVQSEGQSESEAWSEPDRIVSRARIGLNHSVPPSFKPSKLHYNESTEEDEFCNLTPSKKRNTIIELTQDICRLEKELEEKSEEIITNSRMYRQKLQELDREVQEYREKLVQVELEKCEAEKRSVDAEQKVEYLQKVVDELSTIKQSYEENMKGKDKQIQDKINLLEIEKQNILTQSQEYEHQANTARVEAIAAQEKLKELQENLGKLEENIRKQYEQALIEKLKTAEETFSKQVKCLEEKCEAEIQIAQENLKLTVEEYSKHYVKKTDVEKNQVEVEKLVTELKGLKSTVKSYESTVNSYKLKEKEIQGVLKEYQNKVETLKSALESTKEKNAEMVSEKTKINQEKQILEHQIGQISQKEQELRSQLSDIHLKLSEVSQKYDQEVAALQKQKIHLELKISELESTNADLHNRLIKAQTAKFSIGLNSTLPANMGSNRMVYKRQYSDQNTYSSEDNVELQSFGLNRHPQGNNAVAQPPPGEAERAEANSSPDLGIESDHGRFSSLETNGNNIPRPLLQTIELTESMNNLFDAQNDVAASRNCVPEHCCQKSLEIAQENNDLKRKLLKMKRALEETATQLNLANQRKKQVEKTICKQIHKTSQVLRKAKANLDSGSESDVFRM